MNNTAADWLQNRVTLVTGKGTAELNAIGEEINSRAFFVSKLTVAAIANPLRGISDDYSKGRITLGEAQAKLKELGSGSSDAIAQSLMRRSRATQILQTQRQMARGVAEWQSWQENKEDFPYIIYHANNDNWVRPAHKALNGKVFRIDDPFLQTHMPGQWDFNCRCWGEQVTPKAAQRWCEENKRSIELPRQADYDSKSGFMFNPANAFQPDASVLKDKSEMVQSMADSVRRGKIRKMGMIVSSPQQSYVRASLDGLSKMTDAMQKIQPLAQKSADEAGWNPKLQPGYKKQDEFYKKREDRIKPAEAIKESFPGEIEVGTISAQTCWESGLADKDVPLTIEVGDKDVGLTHNWRHHKEVFVDPAEGERILRATMGNPNSQVSVTFQKQERGVRKVITFFDPKTKSYCIALYDDQAGKFRLISWHRSPASYGEGEWEIRGMPKPIVDENGNPVLNENGKQKEETDKARQIEYWLGQRNKKNNGDV